MDAVRRFQSFNLFAFSFAWIPVMYPFFTVGRGFSDREFFQLNAAYYLTMCVLEVPTGVLADRFGRRNVLVAGCLLLAVSFATIFGATSFLGAAGGMALMAVGHTLLSGSDAAWLYDTLLEQGRTEEYLRAESRAHWMRMVGVSACDVAGGFAAWTLGFGAAFALSIASVLTAAAIAATLPEPPGAARPASFAGHVRGSVLRTFRHRHVRWIFFWFTAVFLLLRLAFHFYQLHMDAVGITNYLVYGVVLGLLNVFAAPFAAAAPWFDRRLGEARQATGMLLTIALSFLLLWAFPLTWSVAFFTLQQIPFALLNPFARNYTQRHVPSAERATVFSIQSLAGRLAVGAASFGVGIALERTGSAGPIYLALAAAAAAAAVVFHRTRPRDVG
ncbi:MAG: MFS transporter [Planctomycetota bacterium JB042]